MSANDNELVRAADLRPYVEEAIGDDGSVRWFARGAGVGDRCIASILNGTQQYISFRNADKILTYLGLPHVVYHLEIVQLSTINSHPKKREKKLPDLDKYPIGSIAHTLAVMDSIGEKVALVRYKREWRVCFVKTPEKHITFAGVYFYGGKNLKEATEDAERIASKNGWEFVGRLDKYLKLEQAQA